MTARTGTARRGLSTRGVVQGPVDLRLHERRLVLPRPAAGREEVELVAVAARPVAGAVAAGVEPEGDAVRLPRPRRRPRSGSCSLPFTSTVSPSPSRSSRAARRRSSGASSISANLSSRHPSGSSTRRILVVERHVLDVRAGVQQADEEAGRGARASVASPLPGLVSLLLRRHLEDRQIHLRLMPASRKFSGTRVPP